MSVAFKLFEDGRESEQELFDASLEEWADDPEMVDPETGELSKKALQLLADEGPEFKDLAERLDYHCARVKEYEAAATAHKEMAKLFQHKAAVAENAAKRKKQFVRWLLEQAGLKKLQGQRFRPCIEGAAAKVKIDLEGARPNIVILWQEPEVYEVEVPKTLPVAWRDPKTGTVHELWRITATPALDEIKKALQAGAKCDAACLEQGTRFVIR